MAIIKDKDNLNFILDNQQKEIRAYDTKAGSYIASNAGLFIIALFTVCVFDLIHGSNSKSFFNIDFNTARWWVLLVFTISYVILFCLSNIFSLFVLFPRVNKNKSIDTPNMDASVTNFVATNKENMTKHLENINLKFDDIKEEHICYNVFLLKKKNCWAKKILPTSIAMSVVLVVIIILLFIY